MRKDMTDGRTGIPIVYKLTVVDPDCNPIQGVVVDLWQCDKDGVYSGYASQNTTGQTWLRGMQTTDAQGRVQIAAIYPGWYPNRLTHLHVKIHLGSKTVVTTNLFYPDAINTTVYATDLYKARGNNPSTVANDVELRGDTARFNALTLAFTADGSGGYVAEYTVGIAAVPSSLSRPHPETGGQFRLDRNFPNPVRESTSFRFSLLQSSAIVLDILDTQGTKVERIASGKFGAGEHQVHWRRAEGSVPKGQYLYRLTVENPAGVFKQSRALLLE
jgi:hypothetical protein